MIKLKRRNKIDVIKNIIFADNILKNVALKNYENINKKILHQKIYDVYNKPFIKIQDTIKIIVRNSITSREEKRYLYNLLIKK